MLNPSSKSERSIQSSAEYYRLLELYDQAYDRIQSGGTGMGYSGVHYEVMDEVRRYGRFANGREDAMHVLKQLLKEYEQEHGLSDAKKQSDEDYVNKLDLDDL